MLTSVAAVTSDMYLFVYLLVLLEEVGERPWNDSSVCIALSPTGDRECLARTSLSMYNPLI